MAAPRGPRPQRGRALPATAAQPFSSVSGGVSGGTSFPIQAALFPPYYPVEDVYAYDPLAERVYFPRYVTPPPESPGNAYEQRPTQIEDQAAAQQAPHPYAAFTPTPMRVVGGGLPPGAMRPYHRQQHAPSSPLRHPQQEQRQQVGSRPPPATTSRLGGGRANTTAFSNPDDDGTPEGRGAGAGNKNRFGATRGSKFGGGSAFMHKGFFDLLSLVNSQTPGGLAGSRFTSAVNGGGTARGKPGFWQATASRATPVPMAPPPADGFSVPYSSTAATPLPSCAQPAVPPKPLTPAAASPPPPVQRAAKKRISIDQISAPRGFIHAVHASDADQAEAILMRWSRDGVGKVADPAWALPIKQATRLAAARAQAEAIARIQTNMHNNSIIKEEKRQLHVVNGGGAASGSTLSGATTIKGVQNMDGTWQLPSPRNPDGQPHNPLLGIGEEAYGTAENAAVTPQQEIPAALKAGLPPASPVGGILNLDFDPSVSAQGRPVIPPSVQTNTAEMTVIKDQPLSPECVVAKVGGRTFDGLPSTPGSVNALASISTIGGRPTSMLVLDEVSDEEQAAALVATAASVDQPDFVPSLATVEKCVAAKIYFETVYYALLKKPRDRDTRRAGLEAELASLRIPDAEKRRIREAWLAAESDYLRDVRARVSANAFVRLKTIGHGAFGVVSLVKEKGTGQLYAMKQLRKADMLRKGQEGHVRAERDLMTSAAASSRVRWIVNLKYSFQDVDHLYLIMEFMGGGDLLNLLIDRDVFEEDFARFYVAEMILSIHEAHGLGYIHRDIKPDNFLFTSDGHIKLADFGLCQSFHWAHDGAYYDQQRKHLLHKHGIDLDDYPVTKAAGAGRGRPGAARGADSRAVRGAGLDQKELDQVMSDRNEDGTPVTHVLTFREKNRKKVAYSVVGTNNYMAPDVLRGMGYDQSCDWWSLGVIVFEMLFGYPPFVSKSRHLTRQKILNWRQTLRFPQRPRVSRDAQDFIERLICEKEDRLGSTSTASVSRPNSLLQSARRSGFKAGPGGTTNPSGLADGVEELMSHPWFRGLDFSNLHNHTPPFQPALSHPADTKHFEDDIEDKPLAPPGAAENPVAADQPRDPMLRDKLHGEHLLEMRKQLAFVGYTFKSPKPFDPRASLAGEESLFAGEADNTRGRPPSRLLTGSRLRSMSM